MNIKRFFLGFIVIYILISLPSMFGIGYVIDWVPEATFYQKIKGYVIGGLENNYLVKIISSAIVGIIFSLIIAYCH
ncbi:hypothetical protein [Metabacillus malikii]|uniref:Uncharacterized protein n=1 Tax=Metabacillus malikii TaxID=1504265 RepID=A0ABT9ZLQ0_9BACI|nr:hypothetical protein [Metabacillus malikii]MDQ0233198.1 hypothetical protein [Metabacillus malikii]